AIVAAAGLPEEPLSAIAALASQFLQPRRRRLREVADGLDADGPLDRLQNAPHVMLFARRIDNQVNVVGHEYVSPDQQFLASASNVDRFGQPLATAVGFEERIALVGGKGQLVRVTENIERFAAAGAICPTHDGDGRLSACEVQKLV